MKFVLKPSLEHRALVKIVVSLWNQTDVRGLMIKCDSPSYFSTREEQWETIEEKVIGKVPSLPLPQLLKEKVLGFIKPIGLEISRLKEYKSKHFHINLPAELCWTPQGTVDRKRTAEVLVRDETLNIAIRYEISCFYCLEDDIVKLWNHMPEDLKEHVSHKSQIISFWSRNMKKRELGNLHTNYKDQFRESLHWNNGVAAEYFLKKLTSREREETLEKAAKNIEDDDTLYFLILKMNEEQQMKVFKKHPVRVLKCFLKWPLQSLFIETANCMWNFLSKVDYNCLLIDIIIKVEEGYNDWNYRELFREFWQKSPTALKSLFIEEINKSWLLPYLFRMKDKENIRLILKDATLAAKEKLIYSSTINTFCERSIRYNEWDILQFFVRECFPSKSTMLIFKEQFEKRKYFQDCSPSKKHQWNQFFSFSDDSICKYNKRSMEEGESSSSKQHRSLE